MNRRTQVRGVAISTALLLATQLAVAVTVLPSLALSEDGNLKQLSGGTQVAAATDTLRAYTQEELAKSEVEFVTSTDRFSGLTTHRLKSPISIKAGRGLVGYPRIFMDLIQARSESGDSLVVLQISTYDKDWAFYKAGITLILDNHTRLRLPSNEEFETQPKREVGSGYVTETFNVHLEPEDVQRLGNAFCGEARLKGDRRDCEFVLSRDFIAAARRFSADLGLNKSH